MYKPLIYAAVVIFLAGCQEKTLADLIVTNANIVTVDETFSSADAFAVADGKFLAVGSSKDILSEYRSTNQLDANGKTLVPGLIDGHCHFYNLGIFMQKVDLMGTKSYKEVLDRVVEFQKDQKSDFIIGRGWDQNDWDNKEYPTRKELDRLFPETPVALTRIDGHEMLANKAALELAGIDSNTKIEGGEVVVQDGKATGVLVDNAMNLVEAIIPVPDRETKIKSLMDAQQKCFELGLTSVSDAGLNREVIELIDSLQKAQSLKMRIYAMVSATKGNLDHYLEAGTYKTDKLNVSSFKVYADGALGSRGAVLKESYSDRENHFGAMVTPLDTLSEIARRLSKSDFQMNTHAIGDSANAYVLKTYAKNLKSQTNRRWRIEHAQVVSPDDFLYFTEILPSIQPTHATSDMYWAEDRLGDERIKGAYAFKELLDINGRVVLGTDFPVEKVDPMLTFYAAVARQDLSGYPEGGFQIQNGLSREETLKGMTIWAAYGNFEEDEKGSIEPGKFADFIILDKDIMKVDINEVPKTKVLETYLNGEKVY
ncbi:MAG: amidohydrolase family protein [Lutimonas sp.]